MDAKEQRIKKVLKAISLFDVDTDFGKTDSNGNDLRELLSIYFRELIMNDSEISKSFMKRFLDNVHKIIKDMDIISGKKTEPTDEVDFTQEEPVEEPVSDINNAPKKEEIPMNALKDSYEPLIDFANKFML